MKESRLQNIRGLSLVEMTIVLTMLGAVLAGIWAYAVMVTNDHNKAKLRSEVVQVINNSRRVFGNTSDTSNVTLDVNSAIAAGIFPVEMISGGNIQSAFGTNVTLNINTGLGGSTPTMSLIIFNLPMDACIDVLTGLASSAKNIQQLGLLSYAGGGHQTNGNFSTSTVTDFANACYFGAGIFASSFASTHAINILYTAN